LKHAKQVGLTCWSANPAAQQRRPTTEFSDVVVICYKSGNLKPETGNLKPETGNLKPET
jgi:hypothetical protein